MKMRISIIQALLLLYVFFCTAGCGMFSGPSATVKKLETSMQEGRVDDALKLYSAKMLQNLGGIENARKGLEKEVAVRREAKEKTGKTAGLNNLKETVNGDAAQVSYQLSEESRGGYPFLFTLSKEGGEWKIDNIEGGKQLP